VDTLKINRNILYILTQVATLSSYPEEPSKRRREFHERFAREFFSNSWKFASFAARKRWFVAEVAT